MSPHTSKQKRKKDRAALLPADASSSVSTGALPNSLPYRLRQHAHDLVNGGTNASALRSDLELAATRIEMLTRSTEVLSHGRP